MKAWTTTAAAAANSNHGSWSSSSGSRNLKYMIAPFTDGLR